MVQHGGAAGNEASWERRKRTCGPQLYLTHYACIIIIWLSQHNLHRLVTERLDNALKSLAVMFTGIMVMIGEPQMCDDVHITEHWRLKTLQTYTYRL